MMEENVNKKENTRVTKNVRIQNKKAWSIEDKRKLLFLLHQHGHMDLQLLHEKMPHKSVQEIRELCDYHIKLAEQEEDEGKRKKKHIPPLKTWIRITKNVTNEQDEPIKNLIPRVLKYIKLFEKRKHSSQINLAACYQMLSDMCQGLDIRGLSQGNLYFLRECLIRLTEEVQAPGTGGLKKVLRSLEKITESEDSEGDDEFHKVLNPLHIPPDLVQLATLKENYNMFE